MHVSYQSPLGEYAVTWTDGDTFRLDVTVPPGGGAEVELPGTRQRHDVAAGTWSFES
jgi:hypothetical protein